MTTPQPPAHSNAEELRAQLAAAEAEEARLGRQVEDAVEERLHEGMTQRSDDAAPVIDEAGNEVAVDAHKHVFVGGTCQQCGEREPWPHDTFELYGETWEARKPTQDGLMAFALVTGKFIDQTMQSNFMGLFCREHLSPASLSRMFERLLAHEDEFNQASVGEILKHIAELAKDHEPA